MVCATLTFMNDPLVAQVPLNGEGAWRIGRARTNQVILQDDGVSREHAALEARSPGVYELRDTGSQNGTLVNGRRVGTPTVLQDGDVIQMGGVQLLFSQGSQGGAADLAETMHRTAVSLSMRMATVLVIQVRGFSGAGEGMEASTLARLMRSVVCQINDEMKAQDAYAQKCTGDTVMAAWVHEDPAAPSGAKKAMVALVRAEAIVRNMCRDLGIERVLEVSAAVSSGYASVGNLGTAASPETTVVGETVSRGYALAAEFGDIVLSRETWTLLAPLIGAHFKPIERTVRLKDLAKVQVAYAFPWSAFRQVGSRAA